MPKSTHERNGTLVNRKFYQYLMPTVLSSIAFSLNEFVDSIIVSQILGSDAMSMVNMGSPVVMAFAVVYTFLGVGGSVVFAEYAGRQEAHKAERFFTLTVIISVLVSVVMAVVGLACLDVIASALCSDQALWSDFVPYLLVMLVSSVFIIPLQVLITFFPALGSPATGTAVNVVANTVNLLMDYVYMGLLSFGLVGAGLATITGYVVGALLVAVLLLLKKTKVPFVKFGVAEFRNVPKVLSNGVAPAMNQFGYCVKITSCNAVAMGFAGIRGATVFALCMQVVSIVSIVICGIVDSMTPIAAFLKGQGDSEGIRFLMRTVIRTQFVANVVVVLILEAFPQLVLILYAVDADMAGVSMVGLRIFSAMFVFRGFVFMYMYYFQVIGRKVYATMLSVIDGFAGLIPLVLLFTSMMGINGLWLAFPVLSLLMLVGIVVVNLAIARASNGRYSGLLLTESDEQAAARYELTMPLCVEDASSSAEDLQEFCLDSGLGTRVSTIVAMALEEMAAYSMQNLDDNDRAALNVLDVLVKAYSDRVVMHVRSIGNPLMRLRPARRSSPTSTCSSAFRTPLSLGTAWE